MLQGVFDRELQASLVARLQLCLASARAKSGVYGADGVYDVGAVFAIRCCPICAVAYKGRLTNDGRSYPSVILASPVSHPSNIRPTSMNGYQYTFGEGEAISRHHTLAEAWILHSM
jgi:hypothetical protein